ncbi:DUF4265 domain-containing protein [Actinosynnema sp. CA-248983]
MKRTSDDDASSGKRLYQVAFDLPSDIAERSVASVERLWAEKTAVKMEVVVRNTPFYFKGIANGDVVRVRPDHDRRELVFDGFVAESGHSTVRLVFKADARAEVGEVLRTFGCSWEIDAGEVLWAVDVPVDAEYSLLRASLLKFVERGDIGIEEGAVSSGHRQ